MALARSRHGAVEVLVIDRPGAANAIDLETSEALSGAFDDLERDTKVRAVVITGSGERVFCAGMDLESVRRGEADAVNGVHGGFAGLARREDFPHPIIAAVNGAAIGGGFEIVLACDMAVAAEGALFGLPEVRQGLMAASGGLVRLAGRIPPPLAFELALTGERIDAARAFELGLVNRVVASSEVLATALSLAEGVAANAPVAVRASKRLLDFTVTRGEGEAWKLNGELAAEVLASDDAGEGAAAFAEKRPPRWVGS